ncbi:hypothetical protein DPMN_036135 [Dreissena polymorpha]|uniref:Uncharacterized protein n=1 Tax=Dreissena polymorpha TaxID=45954 RepID=A0A9D4RNJ7_DREPO|nr:hypothetical protein DPMN_036135 [Dreissena polymorpha]
MSNVSSTSDSFTTIMLKKAAEAKAAKLKLEFAAKEMELTKQRTSALLKQADLDAEIEMLHQQKEAATLAVEAEELRKMCNTSNSAGSVSLQLPNEPEDKMNSVKNYIE